MMSTTVSASRANSRPSKEKSTSKVLTQQTQNVKSDGPPSKVQATPEQIRLAQMLADPASTDELVLQEKIKTVKELTGCSEERVQIALHDCKNDVEVAVNRLLEGGDTDQGEWRESGKKKKKPNTSKTDAPTVANHVNEKPERPDKTHKDDQENDKEHRQESNYRSRGRRDNRPPRLSRGRGQNRDRGDRGDIFRVEKEDWDIENKDENSRDRGFDRGRGRGRGFGGPPRRGRGGSLRTSQPRFDKGPQIDTWTNETAEIAEKEPKITNWSDSVPPEDLNEDIDSWTGSLAESKVFIASSVQKPPAPVEPPAPTPLTDAANSISNTTFDLGALLVQSKVQNDISAEASYITQFNQQATESIKNSIGIGSNSQQALPNSLTSVSSQTASNVSALVSLTQNAVLQQDSVGSGLTGSNLTGTVGNSLTGNSLSASIPGNNLSQSLTSQSVISQSAPSSQSAILQQRPKQQRTKLPPPSKIPASAVEMPGNMMTKLDLEFGADSSPSFSFGTTDSVSNAYPNSAVTSSTSTSLNNHMNSQVTKSSESVIPTSMMSQSSGNHGGISSLDQTSPRANLYQPSTYTTPPKKDPASALNQTNKISLPNPIPMPQSQADIKTSPLLSGQMSGPAANSLTQVSLPSSKIETANLSSFTKNSSSYQSSGFQSHKSGGYNQNSGAQPGSYPSQYSSGNSRSQSTGSKQYQSSHNQYQSNTASQFQSSQTQYPTNQSQYQAGQTPYQGSGSQYQANQPQYQSSQSPYQPSQSQFSAGQNQFQNYQAGSAFQNQSNFSSNQSNQNSLYQGPTTTSSYQQPSGQSSLYHQSGAQTSSYQSQSTPSYLSRDSQSGSSFQTSVTQSSPSPYKDSQSVPSSYSRDTQSASSFRESQTNSSSFRDSQTASSSYRENQSSANFRDSQSAPGSYRDSQSAPSSYQRDSSSGLSSSSSQSSSYQRDGSSGLGSSTNQPSYQRDSSSGLGSSTNQPSSYQRDGSSGLGSSTNQSSSYQRDGSSGLGSSTNQPSTYQRDSQSGLSVSSNQTQSSYNSKSFGTSGSHQSTLQSSTLATNNLTAANKLGESLSKMSVKDSSSLDSLQSSSSQFDSSSSTSVLSTSSSSVTTTTSSPLTSGTTSCSASTQASTTVTNSSSTKVSTVPTSTSKAPPNLPPGVPLLGHQYIMGQGAMPPYFGLQQPMYANYEDLQLLQQRLPPLANNFQAYDLSGFPVPTTLTARDQQTLSNVPYSGTVTADTSKMNQVDAQSPIPSTQQSAVAAATGQSATHQQQQPFIHLNYSYYYPSVLPGAGFQYPMFAMPQGTNTPAAHGATNANSQYQKSYGTHMYGAGKVYDDLNQTPDFKSAYGVSQTQAKGTAGTSVSSGTASTDIPIPGYGPGKSHATAFDKQGFHGGTPPPFNLQLAVTGTQAGPLGAPTTPYGAPFMPVMAHQPHSQMMHHPLQDSAASSTRGNQPTGSQPKTGAKNYAPPYWSSN